jgi:UDP-2,3-diacylglucosamine hydrolase
MTNTAYFISDLHLGALYQGLQPDREGRLIRFLEQKAQTATHLFILGDLFEFWMEYRSFIPKEHFRTLAALGNLAKHGVQVHYLSGNHDFNLGGFFAATLGLKIHTGPLSLTLQGKKLLLLHGDGLARADWKYRIMKKIMTHPLSNFCFQLLHPDFGMALARALSKLSRDSHGNKPRYLDQYEAASRHLLAKDSHDIIIHGHTHAAFVKDVPEGIYVNSGEWLYAMTYVAMNEGVCRIETFSG